MFVNLKPSELLTVQDIIITTQNIKQPSSPLPFQNHKMFVTNWFNTDTSAKAMVSLSSCDRNVGVDLQRVEALSETGNGAAKIRRQLLSTTVVFITMLGHVSISCAC